MNINLNCFKPRQDPIFVVGFTRSGTTLLQSLISTQKGITTFPETHFFCDYLYNILKTDKVGIVTRKSFSNWLEKAEFISGLKFEAYEENYLFEMIDSAKLTKKCMFEFIIFHYLKKQKINSDLSFFRWIEKTPYHGFQLPLIQTYYPDAKFVAVVRDPINAIYSTKKNLKQNETYAFLSSKLVAIIKAIEAFKQAYPEKITIIRFEDLIYDEIDVLTGICNFLGIDFEKYRLKNLEKISEYTIQPFEIWKKANKGAEIKRDMPSYKKKIKLSHLFEIQLITGEVLTAYHYQKPHHLLRKIYNVFSFFRSRICSN